jgi:predicted histone-like DNA-binding protein
MPILYKLKESLLNNKTKGLFYARTVATSTIDTNKLASIMQANCTVKRSDILAVISELVETMKLQLQDSKRVQIDGLGAFKVSLRGTGVAKVDDYSVVKNVKGLRIIFQPEYSIDSSSKSRCKKLLEGAELVEAPTNLVVHAKSTSGSTTGGSTTDSGSTTGSGSTSGGSTTGDSGSTGGDSGSGDHLGD